MATANSQSSVALGDSANVKSKSNEAIAIGRGATINENVPGAIAIGSGSNATEANSIALGKNAITTKVNKVNREQIIGQKVDTINEYAGNPVTVSGGVTEYRSLSLGKPGEERTITNVAAGRVSSDSTDAINGSQLYATNSVLSNLAITTDEILGDSFVLDKNTGKITTKPEGIGLSLIHI